MLLPGILAGKQFNFILFVLLCAIIFYTIRKASGGKLPEIRRLPLIDGLEEAVGRAAELGKPVHFATGMGGMHDQWAPRTMAALDILSSVATQCGKNGVPMRYTAIHGYMVPVAQDLIKKGYLAGGSPEMYRDDFVFYTGEDQMSYVAAMTGYMWRERPAANMFFGHLMLEAQQTIAASARLGIMTLGGTPNFYYQPHMVMACDYALIGPELFAASAYVTKDPASMGTIQGEDWDKLTVLVLLILSFIATSLGSNIISKLFST